MYKLPLMMGCGVIPMKPCDCDCDCQCDCKELALTKEQDVENRATYDPTTGVLNLPPAIVARRQQTALGIFVPPLMWTAVAGLDRVVIDGTGGSMVPASPDDCIVIPRDGHFNLHCHAQVAAEQDGVFFVRMVVEGVNGFQRAVSAPVVAGLFGGTDAHSPASPRTAGDTIRVEVMTTCPAGLIVNTVAIAAEYVEGS